MAKMLRISFVVLVACLTSTSHATLVETEPNDTLATASPIIRTGVDFADVGIVNLGVSDVDVFSIDLDAGDFLLVNTAGIEDPSLGSDPDTVVALVDPAGDIAVFDDDDSQVFGSNFTTLIPSSGTYYIAVSGFGDASSGDVGSPFGAGNFTGSHTEDGDYLLTVSIVGVPEPATFGLLGVFGMMALAIRRR